MGLTAFAVPVATYSSDWGFGYGAFGFLMLPGANPWKLRVDLQLYQTTGGYARHFLRVDAPLGEDWRANVELSWFSWLDAPYYGVGNDTLVDPHLPDSHYRYVVRGPQGQLNVRRRIVGELEALGTVAVRYAMVDYAAGSLVDLQRPTGVDGGLTLIFAAGLLVDTRDSEVDPTRGAFTEATVRWLLGDYPGQGLHLSDRRAWSSGPLTVAMRSTLELRRGDFPLYLDSQLSGVRPVGMGGAWSFRGLPADRLRGDAALVLQPELRWTFADPMVKGGPWEWKLAAFADLGRVWTWEDPRPVGGVHTTFGVGLRTSWHDAFVMRADLGVGVEHYTDGSRGLDSGIYLMADHPF